jgi:ATP/maltotriose-dependent transcriptional regulator MalT
MRHAVPRSRPLSFIEEASAPEVAELIVEACALTERERAVTALVCQGCSTRQIAGRLFISEHTVQDHLNRSSTRSASAPDVTWWRCC